MSVVHMDRICCAARPPDACVRGLREVAEAGAELILLNPVFDEAEQMERLVADVMPKLS
jgi:hypothetical protein